MPPRVGHRGRRQRRRRTATERPSFGRAAILVLAVLAVAITLPLLLSPSVAMAQPIAGGAATTAPTTAPPTTSTTTPLTLGDDAQRQVDDLKTQAATVQAQVEDLDNALELSSEKYNQLSIQLDRTNIRLNQLRRDQALAQAEYDRHVETLEERIRAVYKSGGRDQLLPMLFLADGVEDLYNRLMLISQLADQDAMLLGDLEDSRSALAAVLAQIDTKKREELSLRRRMAEEKELIGNQLARREKALAGISTEIQGVIEQERKRQAEEAEQLRQAVLAKAQAYGNYTGPLPLNGDPVVNQFLETAFTYLGVPYVWGGDRPSTGMDCSGFTQFVYAQHGIYLPHYSGYQAQLGLPVNLPDIQPGDLLAFGHPVHHVGIYIGEGMFVHAPRTGDVIKISPLAERTNLVDIRRFPLQPRAEAPAVR